MLQSLVRLADIDLDVEDRDVMGILSCFPSQSVVTGMPVDVHRLSPILFARSPIVPRKTAPALRHYVAPRSRVRDVAVRDEP